MNTPPICPICHSKNTYPDGMQLICPDCSHEWSIDDVTPESGDNNITVIDANGNTLQDGDAVLLIKDLKVKGSSLVIKKGTKVKNIRLVDGDHNIDCKVDGVAMRLKSEFLKKG